MGSPMIAECPIGSLCRDNSNISIIWKIISAKPAKSGPTKYWRESVLLRKGLAFIDRRQGAKLKSCIIAICIVAGLSPAAQGQEANRGWQEALKRAGVVGVYTELGYAGTDESPDIPFADTSRQLQWRVGAIARYLDSRLVVMPSLTLKHQWGSGANAFADIDTTSNIVGAGLSLAYAPTYNVRFQFGGSISGGEQEAVFNAADSSVTGLFSASAYAGVGFDIYRDLRSRITLSDQLAYHYSHADYAPNNSVSDSHSRIISNTLSLSGTYQVDADTSLNASVGLVSLLEAEVFSGEDPLDTSYGIVSVGASHDFGDGFTLYGNIGTTIGKENATDLNGKLGLRIMF